MCVCFLFYLSFYLCCARCVFCFIFCSIFINTFWFSFFLSYQINRHSCHGAYSCTMYDTQNLAHMSILHFLLHFHLSNSCVCVCQLVYALFSSSIFIHIFRHIYMYTCFDYSVMTSHNLYTLIIIRLCVPAPRDLV